MPRASSPYRATRRVDALLVARGLFESRAKAQEAIAAGLVFIDGACVSKPSQLVADSAQIRAEKPYPWVSRAGVKLAAALDAFAVDPSGEICLDLGASTGGFSQVLLSRGAALVYAVEVGRGQLHASLAGDRRLRLFEACDARDLQESTFEQKPSLIVADVSFISLAKALPRALSLAARPARLVALIKPQFEVGPGGVKKGLVKDPNLHALACTEVADFLESSGWTTREPIPSPILGGDGNHEFLVAARRR